MLEKDVEAVDNILNIDGIWSKDIPGAWNRIKKALADGQNKADNTAQPAIRLLYEQWIEEECTDTGQASDIEAFVAWADEQQADA